MQYWIELGIGLVAAVAVMVVAYEGVRIFAAWRRSGSEAQNL
jgi:hypothetical protein